MMTQVGPVEVVVLFAKGESAGKIAVDSVRVGAVSGEVSD